MGVDCELLSEGQLDDHLLFAPSEEGEHAVEKSDRETDQHPHGEVILRDRAERNESESRDRAGVSSEDGERAQVGKA